MYTCLIVEDEPLEMQALHKLVGQYTGQFEEILEAGNSTEALDLARALAPDVILMDINIPGQSGLEVIEILRGEGYAGVIVIITAYSQFAYAQIALRANVVDYLLKPIDRAELDGCLQKIFAKLEMASRERSRYTLLEERMASISAYLQPLAFHALMHSGEAQSTMRALFDWPEDGKLQAFVLGFTFDKGLDGDEQKCLYYDFCSLSQFQFSIVASVEPGQVRFALQALRPEPREQLELSLWAIAVRMMQFIHKRGLPLKLTASPMLTQYAQFPDCAREQPLFPTHPPLKLTKLQSQVRSAARVQQAKAVMRLKAGAPDKALSVFRSMIAQPDTQWAGLFCLLDALLEYDENANVLEAVRYVVKSPLPPVVSVGEWLEKNVSAPPYEMESSSGFIIESALNIIREEFGNPLLSQRDIAEHLGLSQAYFSRLFKKEVGETFISRLTSTRLTHAKELLKRGESIANISIACGYQSKKYFLDAFRQNFGVSVTQYLEEGVAP